jgi:glycosyltransferase involved in cell wall biosynthesis
MVIVIESAFWRLSGTGPHSLKSRVRATLTEALARWSVRHAALSIFTHKGYRDSLASGQGDDSMVTPATWIDASDVIDAQAAEDNWRTKTSSVRLLLAARLIEEKGIAVLLEALTLPQASCLGVEMDVIGDGPLRKAVEQASQQVPCLRLLAPVPYGASFFSLLDRYHAVLVPSVSDEQPRILFDAAARGIAVLASDTEGHREQVKEGVTGWRFAPGDPSALLAILERSGTEPEALRSMGLAARDWARGQTHDAMHTARAKRLASIWRKAKKQE